MKIQYFLVILIFVSTSVGCSRNNPDTKLINGKTPLDSIANGEKDNNCISCQEYNKVNTQILESRIDPSSAKNKIIELIPEITTYFYALGGTASTKKEWVFPVKGYTATSIGGTNGSGFIANGYNYYDGNMYKGHPAHDIFVRDWNQDCLDDLTHKPIEVVSVSNGIVVACQPNWTSGNLIRAGKYIWIFDPAIESYFYFSHNDTIFVKPGDFVKAGQTIAWIGRTGNAARKESPTHLHFARFKLKNGDIIPDNPYNDLKECKTLNTQ